MALIATPGPCTRIQDLQVHTVLKVVKTLSFSKITRNSLVRTCLKNTLELVMQIFAELDVLQHLRQLAGKIRSHSAVLRQRCKMLTGDQQTHPKLFDQEPFLILIGGGFQQKTTTQIALVVSHEDILVGGVLQDEQLKIKL